MNKSLRRIIISTFVICLFMISGCTKKHENENNENNGVKYTITYDLDGGVNSSSNPTEFLKGNEVNLQPATKEGYTFIGWELNGETITTISREITSDVTLKAIFVETIVIINHTIVYELDGGENDSLNPTEFIEGEVVVLQPATKEGYTFIGWELNGEIITTISSEVTSDVTLKAIYEVNAIKHKIIFELDDDMHLEETEIEYIEGVGLESLPIPTIDNDPNQDEDYQYKFVYWYIDNGDESEVVTYISPDETRDFVLKALLKYGKRYRESYAKFQFDIEDKKIYPFVFKPCLVEYPLFNTYALIKIKDRDKIEEVTISDDVYNKVYCNIIDVYSVLKLDDFKDVECRYSGNCNYDGQPFEQDYYIYIPKEIYLLYEAFDTFIVPTKIKYTYDYNDDLDKTPGWVIVSVPNDPISICEFECTDKGMAIDIYPVVDGVVRLNAYKELTGLEDGYVSYIEETYKLYMYDNLSANPTFEEFETWLIKAIYRLEQRVKYNYTGREI